MSRITWHIIKSCSVPSASVYPGLDSYEYDEGTVRSFYGTNRLCDDLIIFSKNKSQDPQSTIFSLTSNHKKIRMLYYLS